MTSTASLARKPLLSVDEVSILLGQSRSSVYRSIRVWLSWSDGVDRASPGQRRGAALIAG